MAVLPEVMRSEPVAQEFEALLPGIPHGGLRLVHSEAEPGHDLPRPHQCLVRMSAAENDEVVSIVHDMSAKHLTAFLLPPVPEEAVHIAVGEQWADHPALRSAAGALLAAAHAPPPIRVRFLDRCLEP